MCGASTAGGYGIGSLISPSCSHQQIQEDESYDEGDEGITFEQLQEDFNKQEEKLLNLEFDNQELKKENERLKSVDEDNATLKQRLKETNESLDKKTKEAESFEKWFNHFKNVGLQFKRELDEVKSKLEEAQLFEKAYKEKRDLTLELGADLYSFNKWNEHYRKVGIGFKEQLKSIKEALSNIVNNIK